MFRAIICILVLVHLQLVVFGQDEYIQKLQQYRDSVDQVFHNPEMTILDSATLAGFHGLEYYPANQSFRVRASFKPIKEGKAVKLKTSGVREPLYRPYGELHFKLNGKKCKLTLYQSADPARPELKNYLLLAFTDLTNGDETYGGGRYLEFTTDEITDEMIVDFNYCFNPYCAYAHRFSCVIPPSENFLNLKITAGVKKFQEH